MDKQPILSICIPTNGALKWIRPVVESIYAQGYDNAKFEVVITDNGKDSNIPQYIELLNYPNLRYLQTNDEGFLNLVTCLKEGRGLFCKMLNHRSVMLPGSIAQMVALVERYQETQPIIYCADGCLKYAGEELIECHDTDTFVKKLSYFCSWSAGIGFWQKDIVNIDKVELNKMFPNTSLLFEIRENPQYVIWNNKYEVMEDDAGKGGYDVFETFSVILLDILNDLRIRSRISNETFVCVKDELYRFLGELYFNEVVKKTKHTFIVKDINKSMGIYYGTYLYWRMVVISWLKLPYIGVKSVIYKIYKLIKRLNE